MLRGRNPAFIIPSLIGLLLMTPGVCRAAGIAAITRPSNDATLSFVRAGRIAKVLVKVGDRVKVGQLLVRLDDEAEKKQLEQLEAQAKDDTRIKAAQAQLEQKRVELRRLEKAERPPLEIDRARLDVTIAALSLQLARLEREQDQRRHQEAKIQLERMRLLSPIAGKVEEIFLEPGESADALQDVIRVVKIDPLRIDVPAPLEEAKQLQPGQAAQVTFDEKKAPAIGKISHIAAEADAASDTLTVRVEVPNPAERPAGVRVTVSFPPVKKKE